MKTKFLLPHGFRKIGVFLFIPSCFFGLIVLFNNFELEWLGDRVFAIYSGSGLKILNESDTGQFFTFTSGNYTQAIAGILCLISLIMIAFSKEQTEDEFILRTRMDSLLWATYINYFILIFCFIFIFGFEFLYIMIFNMFTTLIFFIIRFHYILFKDVKKLMGEK
ncbi:MAG: hypothetical protein IPN86_13995 [Saprospiraceae bacterium]|jgi:hypothetical protein|nr:hypothetical protein [Saprospiraceae bacterium]